MISFKLMEKVTISFLCLLYLMLCFYVATPFSAGSGLPRMYPADAYPSSDPVVFASQYRSSALYYFLFSTMIVLFALAKWGEATRKIIIVHLIQWYPICAAMVFFLYYFIRASNISQDLYYKSYCNGLWIGFLGITLLFLIRLIHKDANSKYDYVNQLIENTKKISE